MAGTERRLALGRGPSIERVPGVVRLRGQVYPNPNLYLQIINDLFRFFHFHFPFPPELFRKHLSGQHCAGVGGY